MDSTRFDGWTAAASLLLLFLSAFFFFPHPRSPHCEFDSAAAVRLLPDVLAPLLRRAL